MAIHIRKNDMVQVIAGDHRGSRGKVLRVDTRKERVIIEGVNMVFRHVRPTRKNPQGGRLQKESPIHISKVLPLDASAGRGKRVRFDVQMDGAGKVVGKIRKTVAGQTLHTLRRAGR